MGNKLRFTTAQIAAAMALLTVFSKLLGFVREMVLAYFFGSGAITDAYNMATMIPGTLLAAVMSAVGTAFLPAFSVKKEQEGEDSANAFTNQVVNLLFLIVGVVVLLGLLFPGVFVKFFAPGFSAETAALTKFYLRITFFIAFGNIGICIFERYLQYKGRFLIQIILGYIQNVAIIVFIVVAALTSHYYIVLGFLIGYLARGFGLMLIAGRSGYRYKLDLKFSAAAKEVAVLALPVFIGGSVSEINMVIDKMLASTLPDGSVSALKYGDTLVGVLITFAITILTAIVYPKLTQAFAVSDYERISYLSERGINLLAIVTVPFTMGAMLYSYPLIRSIYERGAFGSGESQLVATAFFYYVMSLAFYAVSQLITNVFYSMHDMKTAVYCSIAAVAVNIILNLILIRLMGVGGLALATSVSRALNALLLYHVFHRKYPQINLLRSKKRILQIIAFSAVSVGASYGAYAAVAAAGVPSLIVRLAAAVALAVVVYIILLAAFRFEEIGLLKDLIKR